MVVVRALVGKERTKQNVSPKHLKGILLFVCVCVCHCLFVRGGWFVYIVMEDVDGNNDYLFLSIWCKHLAWTPQNENHKRGRKLCLLVLVLSVVTCFNRKEEVSVFQKFITLKMVSSNVSSLFLMSLSFFSLFFFK